MMNFACHYIANLPYNSTLQSKIVRSYRLRLKVVESRREMGYHARTPQELPYSA